jgi:hypothetical protein
MITFGWYLLAIGLYALAWMLVWAGKEARGNAAPVLCLALVILLLAGAATATQQAVMTGVAGFHP